MSTAVMARGWWAVPGSGWSQSPLPESVRVVYLLDEESPLGVARPEIVPGSMATSEVTGRIAGEVWRRREGELSVVYLPAALRLGATVGPWDGFGPRELLDAFAAFERLCGVPWGDSVGRTAEALILAGHPRRKGGRRLDLSPEVPEPARDNALELPYQAWRRALTAEEAGARYVHMFDANAQYLGAWGTCELGHGRPVHRSGGVRFEPGSVGLWRLGRLDGLRLPALSTLPAPWMLGREWFTTPTVVRLLEVCEGFDAPVPTEAWVWPERSRFLRPAGETLRDARAAALRELRAARVQLRTAEDSPVQDEAARRVAVAEAVRQAVSELYQFQTGRFGMAARDIRSGWARPDWGNLVRAQARVNLHRRLSKLRRHPFAIATDGLLFATDEEDGAAFAEGIGLPLGDGLGQFRYEGSAPLARLDLAAGVGKLFEQVAGVTWLGDDG